MPTEVQNYNYYIRKSSTATVEFAKDYFLTRINQRQIDFPEYYHLATIYNLRDGVEYLVISSDLITAMLMVEADRWVVKGGDTGSLAGLDISTLALDETFITDLATEIREQANETALDPLDAALDMGALTDYLLADPDDKLTAFVEDLIQNSL